MSLVEWSIGSWRITVERPLPAPSRVALGYDRAAWCWHPIISALGYGRAYMQLLKRLESDGRLRDVRQGGKVLDAGVGTAALSAALATVAPQTREIHGIDRSPRMLAHARATLGQLRSSVPATQMRYGDVNDLPYPSEHFDMVMSAHLLERSAEPARTIGEMTRVLRPGAPLLIVTSRATFANTLQGLCWRYRSIKPHHMHDWLNLAELRDVRRYRLGTFWSVPGISSEAYIGRRVDPIDGGFEENEA